MPNHITNKLTITGSKEEINRLMAAVEIEGNNDAAGDQIHFSFNGIIPMPECLKNSISGSEEVLHDLIILAFNDDAENYFQAKSSANPTMLAKADPSGRYSKEIGLTPEDTRDQMQAKILAHYILNPQQFKHRDGGLDAFELAEDRYEAVMKYGFCNWYDWSVVNWGTKWDAYDVHVEYDDTEPENVTYFFTTAWGSPKEVIDEMAKLYPSLSIDHKFAGEGPHWGERVYENGECQSESVGESYNEQSLFIEVCGYDPFEMEEEDNP